MRKRSNNDVAIPESVGHVLTDLGLPNGREGTLKVEIASAVSATIREKDLTQAAAGKIIGVDQGKVSELLRGRLTGFSLGRLLVFLVRLGRDVDITISPPHENRDGSVRVTSASA
jgi:predicted XRE-type DNA-binding protein